MLYVHNPPPTEAPWVRFKYSVGGHCSRCGTVLYLPLNLPVEYYIGHFGAFLAEHRACQYRPQKAPELWVSPGDTVY